jgi:SAM-dependent methyltransferase
LPSRAEIETFYNEFWNRRMSTYRASTNARLDAAIEFVAEYVKSGQTVLDVGCGVGIIIENLAKRFPDSSFLGVDISEENIRSARDKIRLSNVRLLHASVTEQMQEIGSALKRPPNVICLVDVIEHLPEAERPALFSGFASVAWEDCALLLTYPSPEYQKHLITYRPEELQIIDNVIEIDALICEAMAAGWKLRTFRYVDVWSTNQYIHAVFVRDLPLTPVSPMRAPLLRRATKYIRAKVSREEQLKR